MQTHSYAIAVRWTGNRGTGTSDYTAYGRDHEITAKGKATSIAGASDPAFRGDGRRYNPEELLVAALAACHMLWVLHLCARDGIAVTDYEDEAEGSMVTEADGGGRFREVTLHPRVVLADAARQGDLAALHHEAHRLCFIAQSVNFPVRLEPRA
ncbi:MAG: OsmC family protein [Terriglobales bacterium]